jgi:predicted nucleic acid-binding protein
MATTAFRHRLRLATLNGKHFAMVSDLVAPY